MVKLEISEPTELKPMDLNVFAEMGDDYRERLVDYLSPLYMEMMNQEPYPEELGCALDTLLQSLGAPGHEFT